MTLPTNRSANEHIVVAELDDLSADSSAYAVATCRGRIVRAFSAIGNAITVADATWVLKIRGTQVGDSVVVANAGSAAGDVDVVANLSAVSTATYVNEGDLIEFDSDGGSTTTCPTTFTVVIAKG